MKKTLVGIIVVIGGLFIASMTPLAEEEWFAPIAEMALSIETILAAGVAALVGAIYSLIKWFESGKGWALILTLIGRRLFAIFEDPENRETAEAIMGVAIKTPFISDLIKKADVATASRLADLKARLTDVECKLESGVFSKTLEAELLKRKGELKEAIANETSLI